MSSLVGTTLVDRYFLREAVGSGGMADVYLAWDSLRSSRMAVKVLRRDLAENRRFYEMFRKEAELLRKLEHPSIVRLYEFDKHENIVFIVMDWVEGTNLRQAISDRRKPFTLDEAAFILQPVCSALNYAHQNQIYHCDVKPANILLHNDGRVFLSDFGVARLASERFGGGTPPYMAPEQFSDGEVTIRSDIYALGITVYEILSGGQVPFRGDSVESQGSTTRERIAWEHTHLPLPSIRSLNPQIPESVERIIVTALNKDPAQRYRSTMDFREAFEKARHDGGNRVDVAQTIYNLLPQKPSQQPRSTPLPSRSEAPKPRPVQAKPKPQRAHRPKQGQISPTRQLRRFAENFRASRITTAGKRMRQNHRISPLGRSTSGPNLFGRSGDWSNQTIAVSQNELTIGRSSQNQLQISESSVSRQHATIIRTRKGIYIRDENSSLGTYLNGRRIVGPTKLKHGDVIQIGHYQIFEFRER